MRSLILASATLLTACGATEYVEVRPDIPGETLTPCPISERQVSTVKELAVLATEHRRSAECANAKLTAVATILKPEGT